MIKFREKIGLVWEIWLRPCFGSYLVLIWMIFLYRCVWDISNSRGNYVSGDSYMDSAFDPIVGVIADPYTFNVWVSSVLICFILAAPFAIIGCSNIYGLPI